MIERAARLKIALFTICSANYLSYALTLGRSISEVEVEGKLHVFLVDRLPEAICVDGDHVTITGVDELALDDLEDMAFRYSILEMNTSLKPYCFQHVFDVLGYDAAIYLDPDILVLKPLDHVRAELENGAACILTPHITSSLNDGRYPDENSFLSCGVFNLGFSAFANVPEARSFIAWWATKTRRDCIVALNRGIFVDQAYCNLAPCFIERFVSLRHPSYNVAYWNLTQRTVTRQHGELFVDGEPVRFVHFSGIEPSVATSFSKHQNRFKRADVGDLKQLTDDYVQELDRRDRHQSGRYREMPYCFGSFRDGRPINDVLRLVYRHYQDELPAGQSPFDLSPSFFNGEAKDHPTFAGHGISRLYATVWHLRADLQRAFDLGTAKGQADFRDWASTWLQREYGLDETYVLPTPDIDELIRWQKDHAFKPAITSRWFMLRNMVRRRLHGKK